MSSAFKTQVELLNSICVSVFRETSQVIYQHASGGSEEVDAVFTEPTPEETASPGRYVELFVKEGALTSDPQQQDTWVTESGVIYKVYRVARDGGGGIVLYSRKA